MNCACPFTIQHGLSIALVVTCLPIVLSGRYTFRRPDNDNQASSSAYLTQEATVKVLASYPRCGTTWERQLQYAVAVVYQGTMTYLHSMCDLSYWERELFSKLL